MFLIINAKCSVYGHEYSNHGQCIFIFANIFFILLFSLFDKFVKNDIFLLFLIIAIKVI